FLAEKLGDNRYAEIDFIGPATEQSALNTASNDSASLAARTQHNEDPPEGSARSQQEPVGKRELESLKQTAAHQAGMITDQTLAYLRYKGYGVQDLAAWHWILTGKTAEDAAMRFDILMKPPTGLSDDFGPVPFFVFLRLLLRTDISWRAFSLLLRQGWQILGSSDQCQLDDDPEITLQSTRTQKSPQPIGLDTLVILVVRLLRHARQVWPAACVRIAQLWVTHARVGQVIRPMEQDLMTERDAARLSFCYNRILSLLALPPNESPYKSLHHRQRAQFTVIRQMNSFNPPLEISREGYRGVVRVQLAHRKTHQERKWAMLKAISWPPWKEDKLGIDAFVGVEHGISRASDSLRQMAEAGYGSADWEKSAGILAGWDTDRSPTIQTRSTIVPRSLPHQPHREEKGRLIEGTGGPQLEADAVWAARIRATRTLQEAWTCFLACKDQKSFLSSLVYHAMFEKVIFEEKRNRGEIRPSSYFKAITGNQVPMPGDAQEVFESSSSHNQAISTREPLPVFDTLFNRMVNDQISPSGRFLELLLFHARTFDEGIRILEASDLKDPVKKVLLPWREPPVPDVESLLQTLPNWLFAAYIGLLCKFAYVRQRVHVSLNTDHRGPAFAPKEIHAATLLLNHAFKLVIKRRPVYRPPWNSLLKLLARPQTVVVTKGVSLNHHAQAIPKFHKARRLLEYMDSVCLDLGFAEFQQFCEVFKNAVVSAKHILAASDDHEERSTAQGLLDDGLSLVKSYFWPLALPAERVLQMQKASSEPSCPSSQQNPPILRLINVPHPAQLHAFIRLLGQYPDYNGLVDLVEWISTFSDQIMEEARESSNGPKAMRTCLTAIRAFVERPLVERNGEEMSLKEGTKQYEDAVERVDRVRKIIESNELWDGWPTDEEVEHYFSEHEQRIHRNRGHN
ncbi:MAG: hypothetical protein Q9225_007689, partial [Loekoesia sp. 1 TL-2023]